ncbi:TetR/AcrR family transcriptional regulator [Kineococcus rubinsiae]|uniref:TetR/AcrR family transcriptional regulator n=1 Tax=Kineococcus rubinsiae TaxID=2609562 RepID=UPI0014322605|nr:TetR/AcrR family transcriptional regulator [Kineococcus rubinsiae]NIZ91374.1 TetR/AcrR family transcriptional regulator [Kineococcus rubinsiae]
MSASDGNPAAAADSPANPGGGRRTVNAYGQGAHLRQEILDAAGELLSGAGAGQGVTLRAIARRAGIAAPSIYRHFADRDAVLAALVEEAFTALAAAAHEAARTAPDPAGAVRAVCAAYVTFAAEQPGRYRVLFERGPADIAAGAPAYPAGSAAFDVLVTALQQAVDAGTSTSSDPRADSAALFACLHGVVTTPAATPGFPWPEGRHLLDRVVTAVARLTPAAPSSPSREGGAAPARA